VSNPRFFIESSSGKRIVHVKDRLMGCDGGQGMGSGSPKNPKYSVPSPIHLAILAVVRRGQPNFCSYIFSLQPAAAIVIKKMKT
jgi:hypothetical protein